jgi:hypothetical protein
MSALEELEGAGEGTPVLGREDGIVRMCVCVCV